MTSSTKLRLNNAKNPYFAYSNTIAGNVTPNQIDMLLDDIFVLPIYILFLFCILIVLQNYFCNVLRKRGLRFKRCLSKLWSHILRGVHFSQSSHPSTCQQSSINVPQISSSHQNIRSSRDANVPFRLLHGNDTDRLVSQSGDHSVTLSPSKKKLMRKNEVVSDEADASQTASLDPSTSLLGETYFSNAFKHRLITEKLVFKLNSFFILCSVSKGFIMIMLIIYHYNIPGSWGRFVVLTGANLYVNSFVSFMEYIASYLILPSTDYYLGSSILENGMRGPSQDIPWGVREWGLWMLKKSAPVLKRDSTSDWPITGDSLSSTRLQTNERESVSLIVELLLRLSPFELHDFFTVMIQGMTFVLCGAFLFPAFFTICSVGLVYYIWLYTLVWLVYWWYHRMYLRRRENINIKDIATFSTSNGSPITSASIGLVEPLRPAALFSLKKSFLILEEPESVSQTPKPVYSTQKMTLSDTSYVPKTVLEISTEADLKRENSKNEPQPSEYRNESLSNASQVTEKMHSQNLNSSEYRENSDKTKIFRQTGALENTSEGFFSTSDQSTLYFPEKRLYSAPNKSLYRVRSCLDLIDCILLKSFLFTLFFWTLQSSFRMGVSMTHGHSYLETLKEEGIRRFSLPKRLLFSLQEGGKFFWFFFISQFLF